MSFLLSRWEQDDNKLPLHHATVTPKIRPPMSAEIDTSRIAGSRFDLVWRFEQDGTYSESWCICESERWRTVFMAPGATLLAAEAREERWGWQIGQWPRLGGERSLETWGEGRHAPVSAPLVIACLPEAIRGWVVDATILGLERLKQELTIAPAQEREHLRGVKRAIEAQLAECADGTADGA
jgi:hypothetical protein